MKLNDPDKVLIGAARPLTALQPAPAWHGFMDGLMTRLMQAWVGLYGTPPRHLPPLL
jgi:hypothetical protein